jgi:hypothetical protein
MHIVIRCFVVTTKHAGASTTLHALARSFTPVILQRLADAEFGLLPVDHFGAEDHIDRAWAVFSTENRY